MQREIKFRGKRLDNGEWVYGDLLRIGGGCLIYFGSRTVATELSNQAAADVAVELLTKEVAVVSPATVGQFTGLKDETGVDVFEGDIVRCKSFPHSPDLFKVIMWGYQGWAQWDDYDVDHPDEWEPSWWAYYFTVIGNIHDNPELLKQE